MLKLKKNNSGAKRLRDPFLARIQGSNISDRSRDSSVSTVIRLGAGNQKKIYPIPGSGQPDRLRGPISLCPMGTWNFSGPTPEPSLDEI